MIFSLITWLWHLWSSKTNNLYKLFLQYWINTNLSSMFAGFYQLQISRSSFLRLIYCFDMIVCSLILSMLTELSWICCSEYHWWLNDVSKFIESLSKFVCSVFRGYFKEEMFRKILCAFADVSIHCFLCRSRLITFF